MKTRLMIALGLAVVLALAIVALSGAVSGAAFTTFNAHVDGSTKDVCKNSVINCNIYGAKEYVWLNGGPSANGLGPDGQYFFAVLVPGGQPNPNDGGFKNLSDDYDLYTNRTFTVTNGEVSAYTGTHWLDSGKKLPGPGDAKPNGEVPYIRLFPYADTWNPGGVYIMAICSLDRGYPVEPRDCKYDAFKVKKVTRLEVSFFLDGMKFLDANGDGLKVGDAGIEGWKVTVSYNSPVDGTTVITEDVYTDANGYWSYQSPVFTFTGSAKPKDITVTVCEEHPAGWYQTFPGGTGCHTFTFTPAGFDYFGDLDFGNGKPAIDVTKACTAVVPVNTPVQYKFVVTNTGNVNLVNVDVDDPLIPFNNSPNIELLPGVFAEYFATKTFTAPTVFQNTVTATGVYGPTTVNVSKSDTDLCSTKVVDARISIVESGKNGITEPHTFVVTVEKNPGTGWVAAAAGTLVSVTETGVGDIVAETCTAGINANGQCTVTVNSSVAGFSYVNAAATVNVEGVLINVATNGYGAYVVHNEKEWVAGSLAWNKVDDDFNLLGGATFTVCRTFDRFGVDIADECQDVTDPDGAFSLTGLVLGRYTITEKTPPPGFMGDAHVETVELTLDVPSVTVAYQWVNVPFEGCTPGFWQGGNDFGTAGGKWLWNENNDPQWPLSGGAGFNPYIWGTSFNGFFAPYSGLTGFDMMSLVGTGGGSDDFQKAARSLVAAYLNASWGMAYPYGTAALKQMWADAVASGNFLALHNELDAANNAYFRVDGGPHCPISASGY